MKFVNCCHLCVCTVCGTTFLLGMRCADHIGHYILGKIALHLYDDGTYKIRQYYENTIR